MIYFSICFKIVNVFLFFCWEFCFIDVGYGCFIYFKFDFIVECCSLRYKCLVNVVYFVVVYILFIFLVFYLVFWKKYKKVKVMENELRE